MAPQARLGAQLTEVEGDRPVIRIVFGAGLGRSECFRYRIARAEIWADRDLEELRPFALPTSGVDPGSFDAFSRPPGDLPQVYAGRGWIGGREVGVEARAEGDAHHLEVEDGTTLSIAKRGSECVLFASGGHPQATQVAVLGPGLAVALAVAGCLSLHAGAVKIGDRNLVFMGESEAGKSTMSALAARQSGCQRIADDVVPVWVSSQGEVTLAPRFPQLKLGAEAQWGGTDSLPCDVLLSLRRDTGLAAPSFEELSARDGLLRLLESTVASRLFSRQLRESQLDTWSLVAGRNRLYDWRVPDDVDRVDEFFDSLAELEV